MLYWICEWESVMRKAVIEIGNYEVREQPTGGWRVSAIVGTKQPISVHNDKQSAIAAAEQYQREAA